MKKEQKERLIQIKNEMRKEIDNGDFESAHIHADNLLCEALEIYGEQELTELFYKVSKWYA